MPQHPQLFLIPGAKRHRCQRCGAWSLTSRTSQARTTEPMALEVPMAESPATPQPRTKVCAGGYLPWPRPKICWIWTDDIGDIWWYAVYIYICMHMYICIITYNILELYVYIYICTYFSNQARRCFMLRPMHLNSEKVDHAIAAITAEQTVENWAPDVYIYICDYIYIYMCVTHMCVCDIVWCYLY